MAEAAPTDLNVRASLGRCHARIGFALRTMGRPAEALRSYDRARAIQEPLARNDDANAHRQEVLSWTLSNLGLIHQELGRPAEAIRLHQRAVAIHEKLVRLLPTNNRHRSDLGWGWRYLGQALAASGDWNAALEQLTRAAALHEELVRADLGDVEFRWRLARCLDEVGRLRSLSRHPADAVEPLGRAAELYEDLFRDDPILYGVDLARNQLYLASQRVSSDRPDDAEACLRRVEDVANRSVQAPLGVLLHDMACASSLWSAAVQDGSIDSAEREARSRRAIAALRRTCEEGRRDLYQLRRDPILDPLRSRRDFQEMMLDLAFPADPFQIQARSASE
jgi:tetratricopeptide (TPR) repeat protein